MGSPCTSACAPGLWISSRRSSSSRRGARSTTSSWASRRAPPTTSPSRSTSRNCWPASRCTSASWGRRRATSPTPSPTASSKCSVSWPAARRTSRSPGPWTSRRARCATTCTTSTTSSTWSTARRPSSSAARTAGSSSGRGERHVRQRPDDVAVATVAAPPLAERPGAADPARAPALARPAIDDDPDIVAAGELLREALVEEAFELAGDYDQSGLHALRRPGHAIPPGHPYVTTSGAVSFATDVGISLDGHRWTRSGVASLGYGHLPGRSCRRIRFRGDARLFGGAGLPGRKDRRDDAQSRRHHRRSADALQHAAGDQQVDARRQAAGQRAEREQHHPGHEELAAAPEVAEAAQRHEEDG